MSGTTSGYASGVLAESPRTPPKPEADERTGGFLSRVTRWLSGAPQSAATPPEPVEKLPTAATREAIPRPEAREAPAAELHVSHDRPHAAAEPLPAPAAEPSVATAPPSEGDEVLTRWTRERVLSELAADREELEALKAAWEARVRQIEAERDQSRSRLESAQAEQRDLHLKIRQMEAMLETRPGPELLDERDRLTSEVASRDREIVALRERVAGLNTRVVELEHTLRQMQGAADVEEPLSASPAVADAGTAGTAGVEAQRAAEGALPAPSSDAQRLADFYQHAMTPLTVLLASADILAMNPRLDPSLRETAQEIRKHGMILRDLIREHTLPPVPPKRE